MGCPGSFLPTTSSAGYIVSVVALLFLFDTVRYALLYYKKPTLPASPPSSVSANQSSSSIEHRTPPTKTAPVRISSSAASSNSEVACGTMSALLIRCPVDGQMSRIEYDPSWTIGQLKLQIAEKISIDVNNFSLLCAGKTLLDDQLLSSISKDQIDGVSASVSRSAAVTATSSTLSPASSPPSVILSHTPAVAQVSASVEEERIFMVGFI